MEKYTKPVEGQFDGQETAVTHGRLHPPLLICAITLPFIPPSTKFAFKPGSSVPHQSHGPASNYNALTAASIPIVSSSQQFGARSIRGLC